MRRAALEALVVLSTLGFCAAGHAQDIDVQHLHFATTLNGLTAVKGAKSNDPLVPTLSLGLVYAREPLVVVDGDGRRIAALVRDRLDAVAAVALGLPLRLGLLRGVDVAAVLPVVAHQVGETVFDGRATGETETTRGVGDPRLEVRLTLLDSEAIGLSAALIPVVSFPAGSGDYLGNGSAVFTPEAAVTLARGPLLLGANLGYRVRGDKRIHDLEVADQLVWRAGAGLAFAADPNADGALLMAEAFGLARASRPFDSARATPVEVLASARYRIADFVLQAGAGTALTRGYSAPRLRALLSVAWDPRARDRDGDGIVDKKDACPDVAEDKDGFEDQDGCPDLDHDRDGLPNEADTCPNEPEDRDGWQDEDGCPDPDDDGDKLLDADDRCPRDPEDHDQFEDEDGCPDPDNDQDGILDTDDKCPLEAEDKDSWQDEDGCLEDDNDGDGIWDLRDKCPNEAEIVNGVDDGDGCPDKGRSLVNLTREKIEIKEAVYFETGSDVIMSRSFGLLDQVAAVLKNHVEIKKVRIEGHTDDRGKDEYNLDLSQRRADSVRRYLVEHGIEGERLEAVGYGETKPVATNKTSRGRELNRRVEFTIVEQAP